MHSHPLNQIAQALVAPPLGILAADESCGTMGRRFASIGVFSCETLRRLYREMLVTTPGLNEFISGVILFDETFRQSTVDGTRFVDVLLRAGILPGIKVDRGTKPFSGFPGEKITEGLDGLRERLADYQSRGARFTKWRAVIPVGATNLPTRNAMRANAASLAQFAALSQDAGLVPIVEPEVLMDGSHSLQRHEDVTTEMLHWVFHALHEQRVRLEGMLLKPNMVLPGTTSDQPAEPIQIAEATLRCLKRTVPAAVPGIVFLSGGQSPGQATRNLNALNSLGPTPWQLSFSFGRALQAPALTLWAGKAENVATAQQALLLRARCNSAARSGRYSVEMEQEEIRHESVAAPPTG